MAQTVTGSLIYVFFGVVWGLMRLMTGRKRIVLSLEGCDVDVWCDTRWNFPTSQFYLKQLRHPRRRSQTRILVGGGGQRYYAG